MIIRTNSDNHDFASLVIELDAYLAVCDGDEHEFYHQFNNIESLSHVVIFYNDGVAVACGAFKEFSDDSVEIKRMYASPKERRKGCAAQVLNELEIWAKELGYSKALLETGLRQTEAIAFYPKQGYVAIENYGQYHGMENSRCFEKKL
jgi:GNAT superfamily N-acetyltransferase